MHEQELSKVPRRILANPFAAHSPREWWYCGVHDPASGCYFSFFLYRMASLDSARVTLFDPAHGIRDVFDWKGWFGGEDVSEVGFRLDIGREGSRKHLSYRRLDDETWSFTLRASGWEVDLVLLQGKPGLSRAEEIPPARYASVQFFGTRAKGCIRTPRRGLAVDGAFGYAEHAWGVYPRDAAWNWISVQNERVALSAMQGIRFQSWSRVHARGVWAELGKRVVFEGPGQDPSRSPWTLRSDDLDLEIEILQPSLLRERIPPVRPVIVDLTHHECLVRARGKVRLDGSWIETGDLHGALEVHHGTW